MALSWLARRMQAIGGKFIDCQLETPHLKSMGGRFIPYDEYLEMLNPKGLAILRGQADAEEKSDNETID